MCSKLPHVETLSNPDNYSFAHAASAINIQTNIHVISSVLCHLHSPPECSASRVQRIIFPKVTRKVHVSLILLPVILRR